MKYQFLVHLACLLACAAEFADDMQVYESECLGENRFHCANGDCVSREQQCDGYADCSDGSDEELCLNHKPDPILCNITHQFMCEDRLKCIPHTWICNGNPECEDKSDETNCTPLEPAKNAACRGFMCIGDGRCISSAWVCDAAYDCTDRSDEENYNCRHSTISLYYPECGQRSAFGSSTADTAVYPCVDQSFCLREEMMCDGLVDCRDKSDEGPFCGQWHSMCSNFSCGANATCKQTRSGPTCVCADLYAYNSKSSLCERSDACEEAFPRCSQICMNTSTGFTCGCEPGYLTDASNACYAPAPEGLLFFSTRNDIRYLKVRSKQIVTVATDIKEAHGVSYDGSFLYWVETAQGHQSIVRARLNDVEHSKEVLVSLGLEDAGDVAVDWMGGHIYFSDAERGVISVCRADGSLCTVVYTKTSSPKFVTLDPRNGKMYWADWNKQPVIMTARMDGSNYEVLVDHNNLHSFATGLALDAPAGRLYYVDGTIKGVLLKNKMIFSLFEEPIYHPFSVAVFENSVYWSDWASNTIQVTDKLRGKQDSRYPPYKLNATVFGMHVYHPMLMNASSNPCARHNCTHFCFITSNTSHSCGCPQGMVMKDGNNCVDVEHYRPHYLLVGAGSSFTRIQTDALGNPETHATHFNIGRVQAMAYDPTNDTLYIYDGLHKTLNYVAMSDFSLGVTQILLSLGLEEIVDMDYDYIANTLYMLDAARGLIEVVSLRTFKRAVLTRFTDRTPLSMCVMPLNARLLVAVRKHSDHRLAILSYALDGEAGSEQTIVSTGLKGPRIHVKYLEDTDIVYFSDEGNSIIDYMHPMGSGRENYRELSTSITTLAVTNTYVFWTDRRNTRLYWSDVHETSNKIRRIEFSIFPNNTHLHIQAVQPLPVKTRLDHPCRTKLCTDICVQTPSRAGFRCLCPPGTTETEGACVEFMKCTEDQGYCHISNSCFDKSGRCDGKHDCLHGEDEEGCPAPSSPTPTTAAPEVICSTSEVHCNGICIRQNDVCAPDTGTPNEFRCNVNEFECIRDRVCISRWQVCDRTPDCPDGSDEGRVLCNIHNCLRSEFMCSAMSCVLSSWRCDGEPDCPDGSDEVGCVNKTCAAGQYSCRSGDCVDMSKRCDGTSDCTDDSDESDCDDPDDAFNTTEVVENCEEWQHACELNRSICLPLTARFVVYTRCNQKVECPGATDEAACEERCARGWDCGGIGLESCLPEVRVCDGLRHCADGSDETRAACERVNRTSHHYAMIYPRQECADGFRCRNGQCIEWRQLCDTVHDCFDGSDEGGECLTSCHPKTCSHKCQPSPHGPLCFCPEGLRIDRTAPNTCVDVDECALDLCSQACYNVFGTYLCSCHHGYVLRTDRRSCKASKGDMSVYFVTGNSVKSKTADGRTTVEYNNPNVAGFTDMDLDVRKNKIYVTSAAAGKLIEVNSTGHQTTVTNIGSPSKVAVDWVTGNVYFVDTRGKAPLMRVCNFERKRCATLQKLQSNAQVTALVVDPAAHRMFYCVQHDLESVVWAGSLAGRAAADLCAARACSGLAADSFRRRLYVAGAAPAAVQRVDYDGGNVKKMFTEDSNLVSPQGLAIFEDHLYYLVANSFELSRCLLFGLQNCEVYHRRVFYATSFVIRHESVQRDDLKNLCSGHSCSHLCVVEEAGPVCLCEDGTISKDDSCPIVKELGLPLFNGWTYRDYANAQSASSALVTSLLIVFGLLLCVLVVYVYFRKKRDMPLVPQVLFTAHRPSGASTTSLVLPSPVVEIPEPTGPPRAHEYTNPLSMLLRPFQRQHHPVGTAGLVIDVSAIRNASDTESDLDEREEIQ